MAVTNVAELNALVERVKKAQREYASFTLSFRISTVSP